MAEADGGDGHKLVLLHFNDVYNIERGASEPCKTQLARPLCLSRPNASGGGAAGFCNLVKSFREGPLSSGQRI